MTSSLWEDCDEVGLSISMETQNYIERRCYPMKWRSLYLRVLYALLTIAALVLGGGAFQHWA